MDDITALVSTIAGDIVSRFQKVSEAQLGTMSVILINIGNDSVFSSKLNPEPEWANELTFEDLDQ